MTIWYVREHSISLSTFCQHKFKFWNVPHKYLFLQLLLFVSLSIASARAGLGPGVSFAAGHGGFGLGFKGYGLGFAGVPVAVAGGPVGVGVGFGAANAEDGVDYYVSKVNL